MGRRRAAEGRRRRASPRRRDGGNEAATRSAGGAAPESTTAPAPPLNASNDPGTSSSRPAASLAVRAAASPPASPSPLRLLPWPPRRGTTGVATTTPSTSPDAMSSATSANAATPGATARHRSTCWSTTAASCTPSARASAARSPAPRFVRNRPGLCASRSSRHPCVQRFCCRQRCSSFDLCADFGVAGGGVGSCSPSQRAASSSASSPTVRSRSVSFLTPRVVRSRFRPIVGSVALESSPFSPPQLFRIRDLHNRSLHLADRNAPRTGGDSGDPRPRRARLRGLRRRRPQTGSLPTTTTTAPTTTGEAFEGTTGPVTGPRRSPRRRCSSAWRSQPRRLRPGRLPVPERVPRLPGRVRRAPAPRGRVGQRRPAGRRRLRGRSDGAGVGLRPVGPGG